jgi:hypothetical protein
VPLRLAEKQKTVLDFLTGIATPRAMSLMAPRGFTVDELKEGWTLLQTASLTRLDRHADAPRDASLVLELDAWENEWFPLAQATLLRHHPVVAEWLFRNLTQADGVAVLVSVATFVRRLREIESGAAGLGNDGTAALALLAKRGLDDTKIAAAESMLAAAGDFKPGEPPPAGPTREQASAAEDALWSWYLEWSAITRLTISDRGMLRAMGYLARSRGKQAPDADEPEGTSGEGGASQ